MNKNNNNLSRKMLRSMTLLGLFAAPVAQVLAQQVDKSAPAGTGIYEAVISNNDGHIYVTAAGSRNTPGGAIYKLDPTSLSVVDSISLKDNPPFGIAINNNTQTVYTTNTRSNSVSAVDIRSGKLLATITHGGEKSHTREVLVDEKNNLIYVSDVGDPSSIWVIDGKTNKYLHTLENIGKTVTGMVLAPGNNNVLYVTVMSDNTIAKVNTKTRKVEKTFPSGGEAPVNIVSDGKYLFVANQKSGTITVLDDSGNLIHSIPTGAGAIGIAYDAVKSRIYSANRQTGTTSIIDANTFKVIADLPTGSHPNNVKVDSKTGVAYVVNKAKGGRPVEGQAVVKDINGDTVTRIVD
ncbi:MAG: YncE family protein [Sphingobacterium sp.]|jgi:YVTN family beta-propeller protein|uniref:YncE family protein n=1 Tax=Sphingobacterium sp. TaxID=341027 RepID=UPI002845D2A4|nr:YncE family protein [Sphingobacterium sp.]MDR3008209.1 YncE family protein [Sphingobacterium sp.]